MKRRPKGLNWEADRHPLDPSASSDPRCWLSSALHARLVRDFPQRLRPHGEVIADAPGVLDARAVLAAGVRSDKGAPDKS